MENISEDIHASNSNHGQVDPVFEKGSSKRLPIAETEIRLDYAASTAQAELSLVANWVT